MARITLIGPVYPYRGGITHFTSQLAEKLLGRNCDLQVISFSKQYPAWLFLGESDKDLSPGRLKIKASFLVSPLNPFTWIKTAKAIISFDPDLIVFQWWVSFWAPCFWGLLTLLKQYKNLFIVHNVLPHEVRFFDRALTKIVLKMVDSAIVLSRNEMRRLMELVPSLCNIQVCPLPIFSLFNPIEVDQLNARKKIKLSEDGNPVVLFFGMIRAYKGLIDLLYAVKQLKDRGVEVNLLVVGEFWENKRQYYELVSELGIESQVVFSDGYISDGEVGYYFKAADLYVAPYRSGTQSASTKVALSFGIPMVITDVISDNLITAHPELCRVVKPYRPDLLADAIENSIIEPKCKSDGFEDLIERSWMTLTEQIFKFIDGKECN